MNILALKNFIKNNPDRIKLILEKSGFYHISYIEYNDEIRCARKINGNKTSVRVMTKTLWSACFSTGIKGDIITLIQEHSNMSFIQTLRHIADIVGFVNYDTPSVKKKLPFGGYYKSMNKSSSSDNIIRTYNENILNRYFIKPSVLFIQDGLSPKVQEKYGVMYDIYTKRTGVAWRSVSGELVGIMGRYNSNNIPEGVSKWKPIIAFPKSLALFGYSENYKDIVENNRCFVFESEKAPMQMESKEIGKNNIALGGSSISEFQSNHIKSLNIKEIILCYDEGMTEEFMIEQSEKLMVDNLLLKNRVGYIYDKDNCILKKGSKMSPSDLSAGDFKLLLKKCLKWRD